MTDTRNDETPHAHGPMIPGGRDPGNLTHREPGAVGGQFSGADIPPASPPLLDDPTAHERAREGGGADGEHALFDRARDRQTHERTDQKD